MGLDLESIQVFGMPTMADPESLGKLMTEREMFEQSFKRPKDFFKLSAQEQWYIDKDLGILDWEGTDLSEEDLQRIDNHYKKE